MITRQINSVFIIFRRDTRFSNTIKNFYSCLPIPGGLSSSTMFRSVTHKCPTSHAISSYPLLPGMPAGGLYIISFQLQSRSGRATTSSHSSGSKHGNERQQRRARRQSCQSWRHIPFRYHSRKPKAPGHDCRQVSQKLFHSTFFHLQTSYQFEINSCPRTTTTLLFSKGSIGQSCFSSMTFSISRYITGQFAWCMRSQSSSSS